MNKLGLRITNNGREAYVVNPNHDWELHTVDFNACLLTLDNLGNGDGLIILSHDSGGCYVGFVHLLKQGFNGLCIAASIFVPENLSVDGNTMRRLVFEVRKHLQGAVLDIEALDRLFANEYPDKDYIPEFQPQRAGSIACRIEEWTEETLDRLLDSRCLFQPVYASHRATLLVDSDSEIICDGINITAEPVVIPQPASNPVIEVGEPSSETDSGPEPAPDSDVEVIADSASGMGEISVPEVEVISTSEEVETTPFTENNQELEVIVLEEEVDEASLEAPVKPEREDRHDNSSEQEVVELSGFSDVGGFVSPSESGSFVGPAKVNGSAESDDGVDVVSAYPIPPNATVPPPPLSGADEPNQQGFPDSPINYSYPNQGSDNGSVNGPDSDIDGNGFEESKRKFMLFLIFLLVGILLVFLVGVSFSKKEKRDEEQSVEEVSTSASTSVSYQLEQPSDSTEEVSLYQQIYEAYVNKLEALASSVGGDGYSDCEYFLYDITGDYIPELWVKCGTCEADYMLYVYRYGVGQLELMHATGAGHSSFYCGDDYVLQIMAHMGIAEWYKIELSGSGLCEEMVYEESDIESSDDYTQPVEPEAYIYNYDETWPIASALGV